MRTLKQEFFSALIVISVLFLWDNKLLIIASAFLIYIIGVSMIFMIRTQSKSKNYLTVQNPKSKRINYISLLIGMGLVIWGLIEKESSVNFLGIEGKIIIGSFFIIIGFLNTNRYHFVLTKKSVIFNDDILLSGWKLRKLDYMNIYQDKILFVKGPQVKSYNFDDNLEDLNNIIDFVKDIKECEIKMNHKLSTGIV
jgi:hypothetical protein